MDFMMCLFALYESAHVSNLSTFIASLSACAINIMVHFMPQRTQHKTIVWRPRSPNIHCYAHTLCYVILLNPAITAVPADYIIKFGALYHFTELCTQCSRAQIRHRNQIS